MKSSALLVTATLCILFSCTKETEIIYPDPLFPQSTPLLATLFIHVIDEYGNPVQGARVTIGPFVKESDYRGWIQWIDAKVTETTLISVKKENYFNTSRRVHLIGNAPTELKFILLSTNDHPATSHSADGLKVTINNFELNFKNDGFQSENGEHYAGDVVAAIQTLSIDDPDISFKMPGNLTGLNKDNAFRTLTSLGMIGVELKTPSGEKLNIREGRTVEIKFPVADDRLNKVPPTIPMWYYDESLGVWKEEGEAHLIGKFYVANVSHFSFWNCDAQFEIVQWGGIFKQHNGKPLTSGTVCLTVDELNSTACGSLDQEGRVRGDVAKNLVMTMQVMDGCGDEVYSGKIGPYAEDYLNGSYEVDVPNNLSMVSGTVYDCNHFPVSHGFVVINTSNHYYKVSLDNSGSFKLEISAREHEAVTVQAYNADNLAASTPKNFVSSPEIQIDTISACLELEEYFILDAEGMESPIVSPYIDLGKLIDSCPLGIYSEGQDFTFGLCLKRLRTGFFPNTPCNMYLSFQFPSDTLNLITTHYIDLKIGRVGKPGGFVEGSFTGKLKLEDGNIPGAVVPFNGKFRVKREE